MFKSKTNKKTSLELVQELTIEELLEDGHHRYLWNKEDTDAILAKCTSILHYARLHTCAFKASQHTDFNNYKRVRRGVLDTIYFDLTKAVSAFLKDGTKTDNQVLEVINTIHSELEKPWNDRENSPERRMLQTRLEVRWRILVRRLFGIIKEKQPAEPSEYEQLFFLCKKDDPITLEIAEEINNLS